MVKNSSKIKTIFEDSSLTDQQKYKKINHLANKGSRLWIFVISLNTITLPLLFITPNLEINNQNLNPIVALKDLKS